VFGRERLERVQRRVRRRRVLHVTPDEHVVVGTRLHDPAEVLLEHLGTNVDPQLRGFHRHTAVEVASPQVGDQPLVGRRVPVCRCPFVVVFAQEVEDHRHPVLVGAPRVFERRRRVLAGDEVAGDWWKHVPAYRCVRLECSCSGRKICTERRVNGGRHVTLASGGLRG
jgi:hypothetical protein